MIEALANRRKVDRGCISRVVRLSLLAPDIVEGILDRGQPEGMRLEDLLNPFPAVWSEQRTEKAAERALHFYLASQVGRREARDRGSPYHSAPPIAG